MLKYLIAGAAAMLLSQTALAAPTCVIILPTDVIGNHQPVKIVELHEKTHCKGWELHHGPDAAIIPPVSWQRKPWPKDMRLVTYRYPTAITEQICASVGATNTYACQWFDPNVEALLDTEEIVHRALVLSQP